MAKNDSQKVSMTALKKENRQLRKLVGPARVLATLTRHWTVPDLPDVYRPAMDSLITAVEKLGKSRK